MSLPFSIGEVIFVVCAMYVRDWWKLQIVVSAPLFGMLALYFILPESPRWLIATGRYEEAKETLEKAAKSNKVQLSSHLLSYTTGTVKKIGSCIVI